MACESSARYCYSVPPITITETVEPKTRAAWRAWLEQHHTTKSEIWLLAPRSQKDRPHFTYVDSVNEALCFGWIDGIAKTYDDQRGAQRFTPRRKGGNWTELNKERCRRLIADGLMTPAGFAVLPDLDVAAFRLSKDIEAALRADPAVWANFEAFEPLYQRIRVGYIEDMRKSPDEFQRRLDRFIAMTAENKTFGGMT
jgi:uncharacterized protein YdeI (YjbR/CyaY-like superfamily)